MEVSKLDIRDWKEEVLSVEKTTFFHYPEWYSIWEQYNNQAFECLQFIFEKEQRILLPLSRTQTRIRGNEYWVSSPQGTYGGMISKREITSIQANNILRYLGSNYPSFTLFTSPFTNTTFGGKWKGHTTQMINLDCSWDDIEGGMKKARVKGKLKVAGENKLDLRKMPKNEISAYYTIYKELRKQWNNPTNDYQQGLFDVMHGVDGIDFWGLYIGDKLIGGGPFMKHRSIHVSSWLPVCDRAYTSINANLYMYYTLIKYYKEHGFQYFDFNPSGGHSGVHAFKKKLGAQEYFYYEYEKLPIITKISNMIRGNQ